MKKIRLFFSLIAILLLISAGTFAQAQSDWPLLDYGDSVEGEITNESTGAYYRFNGSKGDVVTVTLTVNSGDLAPLMGLGYLDKSTISSGYPELLIRAEATSDGAVIDSFELPDDCECYIVVSREGLDDGDSEGEFVLTLESGNGSGGNGGTGGGNADVEDSACLNQEYEIEDHEPTDIKEWDEPEQVIDLDNVYCAVLTTSKGQIIIELYPKSAPENVNSFVFLAINGFYDNVLWHRVIPDFVAQTGDPVGDPIGTGGPGYTVPLEIDENLKYDRIGRVGAARANDPDSAGSQFFITYAPLPSLDPFSDQLPDSPGYTIIGQVVEGMGVVEELNAFEAAPNADTGDADILIQVDVFEITPNE